MNTIPRCKQRGPKSRFSGYSPEREASKVCPPRSQAWWLFRTDRQARSTINNPLLIPGTPKSIIHVKNGRFTSTSYLVFRARTPAGKLPINPHINHCAHLLHRRSWNDGLLCLATDAMVGSPPAVLDLLLMPPCDHVKSARVNPSRAPMASGLWCSRARGGVGDSGQTRKERALVRRAHKATKKGTRDDITTTTTTTTTEGIVKNKGKKVRRCQRKRSTTQTWRHFHACM